MKDSFILSKRAKLLGILRDDNVLIHFDGRLQSVKHSDYFNCGLCNNSCNISEIAMNNDTIILTKSHKLVCKKCFEVYKEIGGELDYGESKSGSNHKETTKPASAGARKRELLEVRKANREGRRKKIQNEI